MSAKYVPLVISDPHAAAPVEAEALRVRTLRGVWRWLLIVSAALTIFLCINQQFVLRFFVGFTPLNTEYYYALVLVTLPFVFVIFPGSARARIDRVPWYDVALFALTIAATVVLLGNIRRAAELGWEFTGAPAPVIAAGAVMWALLMEGLRRTGG
ncbi:MAG: TRAP transporter permease, partial [Sulfurifustaceae bacterium]